MAAKAEAGKEAQHITRLIKAVNPNHGKDPTPPVVFHHKKELRTYKPEATIDHCVFHFSTDGNMMEADESKNQKAKDQRMEREARKTQLELAEAAESNPSQQMDTKEIKDLVRILKNQFNYCDRASQTFNNPMRERQILTDPPPSITFSNTATQWEIYDAYVESEEKQKAAQRTTKAKSTKEGDKKELQASEPNEDILASQALLTALKIMERMVNQNSFNDITDDYKYWQDAADRFNGGRGTLLPLWTFNEQRVKGKTVTGICWNTKYVDLFAVGYGSYEFLRQGSGMIQCFTLKNHSYPEYRFSTETGVMCLDFHPKYSFLLACGLYDGTVEVFDVRQKNSDKKIKPIYKSTVKTGKHTDPVWQVYWQRSDNGSKNLNFFSVSSDGRVTNWTLSKNELQYNNVIELKPNDSEGSGEGGKEDLDATLAGLSGGTCFDFNKFDENLFIVGTEEGKIKKCSKAYSAQYLETYEGHYMAVYTVCWNHFHKGVFLSASADWTVKLWVHTSKRPLISFDVGSSVGDVAWAPYSSTVFAAVTSDGRVYVYDLDNNNSKYEAICDQPVVKRAKLTKITFNPRDPIILVGDNRGNVAALKLSPNLRRTVYDSDLAKSEKGVDKALYDDPVFVHKKEVEKLDKIINITLKDRELLDG